MTLDELINSLELTPEQYEKYQKWKTEKAPLTIKQAEVFRYLKRIIKEKGYAPTIKETSEAFGLKSTSTMHEHLTNLSKKKYIRRDLYAQRGIKIL